MARPDPVGAGEWKDHWSSEAAVRAYGWRGRHVWIASAGQPDDRQTADCLPTGGACLTDGDGAPQPRNCGGQTIRYAVAAHKIRAIR